MVGTYSTERPVDNFRSSTNRWLFGSFTGWLTILGCAIGVGLIVIAVRWLQNLSASYEITDQRLIVKRGLVMKSIDEIELYRIKDVRMNFTLLSQWAGTGTICLTSSDETTRVGDLVMRDVEKAQARREEFRRLVDAARRQRGVREIDMVHEDI